MIFLLQAFNIASLSNQVSSRMASYFFLSEMSDRKSESQQRVGESSHRRSGEP